MKIFTHELSSELQTIELHTFADLHIGDAHCDIKDIKRRIAEVAATPNAYAILNGDIMDNATKTSIGDTYTATLSPEEQVALFAELFEPIKDRILCITSGNHEARTYKKEGVDLMHYGAVRLGLHSLYAPEGAVVFVRFGTNIKKRRQRYSIYVTHGVGGGKLAGSKANILTSMAGIIDCDIYIHSHTHLPMIIKEGFFRTDCINSTVAVVEKLFINTSAELDYGGYGQVCEYKPSSKSCPIIHLEGRDRIMSATL